MPMRVVATRGAFVEVETLEAPPLQAVTDCAWYGNDRATTSPSYGCSSAARTSRL